MSLGAKFERLLEAHIVCAHQSDVQEFRNVLQVNSLHPVAHRSDARARAHAHVCVWSRALSNNAELLGVCRAQT